LLGKHQVECDERYLWDGASAVPSGQQFRCPVFAAAVTLPASEATAKTASQEDSIIQPKIASQESWVH